MNRENDKPEQNVDTNDKESSSEISSHCEFHLGDLSLREENDERLPFLPNSRNVNNNVKDHNDGHSRSAGNLQQAQEGIRRTGRNQRRFSGNRPRIYNGIEETNESRHAHRSPKLRSIRTSKSCTKECDILGSDHSSIRGRRRSRGSSNGVYLAVINAEFRLEVISDEGSSSEDFGDHLISDEEEARCPQREVALNNSDQASEDDPRGRRNSQVTENQRQAFPPSNISYVSSSEDQGSNRGSDIEANQFERDSLEEMRLNQTDSVSIFLNSNDTFSSASSKANSQYEPGSRCSLLERDVQDDLCGQTQNSRTKVEMESTGKISPIPHAGQSEGDSSNTKALPRASSPKEDAMPFVENYLHRTCSGSFETDTNCSGQSHSYVPNENVDGIHGAQDTEIIALHVAPEKETRYERRDHNDVYWDGARVDGMDEFKDSSDVTPRTSPEARLLTLPVAIRDKVTTLESIPSDGINDTLCNDLNYVEGHVTDMTHVHGHKEAWRNDCENHHSEPRVDGGHFCVACKSDRYEKDPQRKPSDHDNMSRLPMEMWQAEIIAEKSQEISNFTSEDVKHETKSASSQKLNVNDETQDTSLGKSHVASPEGSPVNRPLTRETENPNVLKSNTANKDVQQEPGDESETENVSPRFDDTMDLPPNGGVNTKQQSITVMETITYPKDFETTKKKLKSTNSAQSVNVKRFSPANSKDVSIEARKASPATVHRNPDFLSFLLSLKDEKEDKSPTRNRKLKGQSNKPIPAQGNTSDLHDQNDVKSDQEESQGPRFPRGIDSSPIVRLKPSASLDNQIRSLNVKKIASIKKRNKFPTQRPKTVVYKKKGKVTALAPKKVQSIERNAAKNTFPVEQQTTTDQPTDSEDQENRLPADVAPLDATSRSSEWEQGEEDRFPLVDFQHLDGDSSQTSQSTTENVRELETMIRYLENKVSADQEGKKEFTRKATEKISDTGKAEATSKRTAQQPNTSFRIQRVTHFAPSIINQERLCEIRQPKTDPNVDKNGGLRELRTARSYHQRWPQENPPRGPPSLTQFEGDVKIKGAAVQMNEEIYIEEDGGTDNIPLRTHVPALEMTYLDLLQTQADMSKGELPRLPNERSLSSLRRSRSVIDFIFSRSCTGVSQSLRAIHLQSRRPATAKDQAASSVSHGMSRDFIERPSTRKKFRSLIERASIMNIDTGQHGIKKEVDFAAVNKCQASAPKGLPLEDEDYWSSTVNTMLLRAEKAKMENQLQENEDHRFPRSDSARVVHPVRQKGVGFLSHLLEQDRKERKLKSNRRTIHPASGCQRVDEKRRRRKTKPTHQNSSLHYRYSNNIPEELPLQKLPLINSNQNLVAATNSAGVLKIKTSASRAAQKRAFVTHHRMINRINLDKRNTTEPSKRISQSPERLPQQRVIPIHFPRPTSSSIRPPSSTAYTNSRSESFSGLAEARKMNTISGLPKVEYDDGPKKNGIELRSSSPSNFLLDQYSDVFQYYNSPFLRQKQTVVKELFGNQNTNASSGNVSGESENADDPPHLSKDRQKGSPGHENNRKTANSTSDHLEQGNFVYLTSGGRVSNLTSLKNYLERAGISDQKDQYSQATMTMPALSLKYGLSDDPDALTVVDSKSLSDDEYELTDDSCNNLYLAIPGHTQQLRIKARKFEPELVERDHPQPGTKKSSGLKSSRRKRKHFPRLKTGKGMDVSSSTPEVQRQAKARPRPTRAVRHPKKDPQKLAATKTRASTKCDNLKPRPFSVQVQEKATYLDVCVQHDNTTIKRRCVNVSQSEAEHTPHPGFVIGQQTNVQDASPDKRNIEEGYDHCGDGDPKFCHSKDTVEKSSSDLSLESFKSVQNDDTWAQRSECGTCHDSPDSCNWVDILLKHSDSTAFPQPRDCLFICQSKPLISSRPYKGRNKSHESAGNIIRQQKKGDNFSAQRSARQYNKVAVFPSTSEKGNFPGKDFLRMLRGKELISMLTWNEHRLLQTLQAVTQTSHYLPVFHVRSLDPATVVPKMLNLHFCTDHVKFGMDSISAYQEIKTMMAFYIHERGSHSLYTVRDIPRGLYSIEETASTPYPTNQMPPSVDSPSKVKQVNLVQFPAWALGEATARPKLSIIGPWSSEREHALECQTQMFKSFGHDIEKYFLEVLNWRVTVRGGSIFFQGKGDDSTSRHYPHFQIWRKRLSHEDNSTARDIKTFSGTNFPTAPTFSQGKCMSDTDARCYKCGSLIGIGEDSTFTTQKAEANQTFPKMMKLPQRKIAVKMLQTSPDVGQSHNRDVLTQKEAPVISKSRTESLKNNEMADEESVDDNGVYSTFTTQKAEANQTFPKMMKLRQKKIAVKMLQTSPDVGQSHNRDVLTQKEAPVISKSRTENLKNNEMADEESVDDNGVYFSSAMTLETPLSEDRISEEAYKLSFWSTNKIMSTILPPPYLKKKPHVRKGIRKRFVPARKRPQRPPPTVSNIPKTAWTPSWQADSSSSDETSSSTCSSSTTSSSSSSCTSPTGSSSSDTDSDDECPYTHFHPSYPLMSRLKPQKPKEIVLKKLGEKPAASAARLARLRDVERQTKEQEEFEERQQIEYMAALRRGVLSSGDQTVPSFAAFQSDGTSPRHGAHSTIACKSEFDLCPEVDVIREMWEDIFPKTNFWAKKLPKKRKCPEMYLRLGSC